ncbi:hypothetical protein [Tropicimonas sp. IMCC34043]|uniref:hypothetical protein n=1 Tax=Tropicimonas sp. IMCC34043 TaxID=2248760 RepID=UPI000E243757|nr:hypothetical protein [Tropicimonas sp. IMCC34043]
MAQVPATPKSRRVLIRLAAATLGPQWCLEHMRLQASETAALQTRLQPRPAPPKDPVVVFLIPLVGSHHVGNWADVERRLADTIASFRGQTSPRWRALICGQTRPDGIAFDDQVRFLRFTRAFSGNDKWAKLGTLSRFLPDLCPEGGYAMPFDADDLLNRNAVKEMVTRADPNGYLVTQGLVRDAQSGAYGLCAPQTVLAPGRKPFWKMCGSCAAFRVDFSQGVCDAAWLATLTSHEHRMFPYLAALAGRPLAPLRQQAVTYIVNHGENFGIRRGRVGFKTRYVARFPVTDREELRRIASDFPAA